MIRIADLRMLYLRLCLSVLSPKLLKEKMTLEKQLDGLLISATESDHQEILSEIITALENRKKPLSENIKDGLSMIIETWQTAPNSSPNTAKFLIEIAQFFDNKFRELRSVLPTVIKKTLPPGINKATAIKALKIRDENTSLSKFYIHYKNLTELKPERFFYNTNSEIWGKIEKIDWMMGTIILSKLDGTKLQEVELPIIIDQICIFDSRLEINNLPKTSKLPASQELIDKLTNNAYSPISKNIIRRSLLGLLVPDKIKLDAFEKWWKDSADDDASTPDNAKIKSSLEACRSINELNLFIKNTSSCSITADNNIEKLSKLFNIIKPTNSVKDYIFWAETLCLVSNHLPAEKVMTILPENKKVIDTIWPDLTEEAINSIWIETWCQLKVGLLPSWTNITEIAKGANYLAELCLYAPWRCWKSITTGLKIESIEDRLLSTMRLSNPEALLWIWKNRQKLSAQLTNKLNHANLFSALARKTGIAIWEEAKKELKKLIQDNAEFQNVILQDNNEKIIIDFLERLNLSTSFATAEKQSLIVKLSRKYPIFKKIFESGKAKRIILSASKDKAKQTKREVHITSPKSYNEKIAELNDITNVQIPENTRAIATARAHGDLRENAEYAAAKERQKYLNEHRAMLEIGIATTQPTDFSDIKVSDRIVAGSSIHLKLEDGKIDVYHILGAWDSNPDKNYVSYETKLGKTLINKKLGDPIILPGGKTCIIEKITPIPENVRKDLM